MNDVMISIRMPKGLIEELRALAVKNHYMDLSDEIRQVIKQKCLANIEPYKHELSKVRETLEKEIITKKTVEDKEKLIIELKKIIDELKK
jgi:Arc/MetJ-type ribon-helix-helix transcriptional regulator